MLVALLVAMIVVAVYQVIARNAFGTGLLWGDAMVRIAVLWVTMVGASVAAGTNGHINIDIVDRFAGERVKVWILRLRSLFAAAMCAALGWYSLEFIRWDYVDGTIGFGVVPAWVLEAIIPVGAGMMAIKYLVRAVAPAPREEVPP